MRVLQVLEATGGGTRRHLREILTELNGGEFEFSVVCSLRRERGMADDVRLFRQLGIEVQIIDMVRRPAPWLDLRAAIALRAYLRKNPVDLIHLHSSKAGFIGRLATLGLNVPVLYSPHGFPFLQSDWTGRVSFFAEKALAWKARALVAVSQAEGRLATSSGLFDSKRVIVVENCVGRRAPPLPPSLAARERPIAFGFLGELRAQKDPLTFVRAARLAFDRGLRARFVMPRRGPDLGAVQHEIARLALQPHFELVPAQHTLDEVHEQSDLGVLPSRWEGLPYSLLDSMAMGKPTITSSLDVFRDLLEPLEPALLFKTGSVESLANRLLYWQAVQPERLDLLGRAAAHFVARSHATSIWRTGLARVYQQIIRDSGDERRAEHLPVTVSG